MHENTINYTKMKQKFLFLLIALLSAVQVMATNLVIERYTGAEMAKDIALIGKWVFVGTDLLLLDKADNVLATEAIDNVRKIVFAESSSTALDRVEEDQIVVYPNPTHDMLYINGIDNQTLRVYDLQGRLLLLHEGTEVSVEGLSAGTYLLQIGTQVVRFIKN